MSQRCSHWEQPPVAWEGSHSPSHVIPAPWISPDGKLYDAYVSHANAPDDRKFIHFIVKPQLENRHGYKLFLDQQNILPNSGRHQAGLGTGWHRHLGALTPFLPTEPSADLIMNVSRCRRLIVVLSVAYLEQEWCNSSFR